MENETKTAQKHDDIDQGMAGSESVEFTFLWVTRGFHIYLKVWVLLEPGWANDDEYLALVNIVSLIPSGQTRQDIF